MKRHIYIFVTLALGLAAAGALAQLGGGGYGGGGISGPSSVTDNAIVRYDGTTGKRVQGSGVAIDDNNAMTNASQPCFLAYNSVTDLNVTGAGTTATVDFDTEVFDQGADFAADTFTAPVTGRYLLMATVRVDGITTAGDELDIAISTSNRIYRDVWASSNNMPVPVLARSIGVVADMDAADTATVTIQGFGEASNVMDVSGTTAPETFFSGCLMT